MGFDVLRASNGQQAVSVFCAKHDEIVCVLLDLTMPGISGKRVFAEIRRTKPDIRVLLSSELEVGKATEGFSSKGLAGFIPKPYTSSDIREVAGEVMAIPPPDPSGGG